MSDLMRKDTLTTVSSKDKANTFNIVPVSALRVQKIDSADFSAWKLADFSSFRPAVRIGQIVVYKAKEGTAAS